MLHADRHPAIRTFCRQQKTQLKHYFDVRHIAEGMCSLLPQRTECPIPLTLLSSGNKAKQTGQLAGPRAQQNQAMLQPITNHLYWVAGLGQEDGVNVR